MRTAFMVKAEQKGSKRLHVGFVYSFYPNAQTRVGRFPKVRGGVLPMFNKIRKKPF
jgi:hypothetical protein